MAKYTIEEFRQRLLKIADPKQLGMVMRKPLREGQRDIGRYLKWHYWQHPLASKVWKWRNEKWSRKGGPVVRTKKRQMARWSQSEQAYIAKVEVSGLAAKLEMGGGRLRRHEMWGRASDARQPGLMVSRKPAMDRVIAREWPRIVVEVESAFHGFIKRTL